MKILHAFSLFSPQSGGGTVDLMYKIMKALCNIGHEVTLFTGDFELDEKYISTLSPVEVVMMHSVKIGNLHIIPESIKVARKKVREFDIIHLHAQRSLLHLAICYYAVKYGVPYVIDAHGSTPMFGKVLMKSIYDRFAGTYIYKHCSQFIAENRLGENEYIELGIVHPKITIITPPRDMITIINPPMEVETFNELPSGSLFKQKFSIPDKMVVMFLGRIHKMKGINYLIDGFYELLKRRNDVVLVISGSDDGGMETLKRQIHQLGIENEVIFTGFITGNIKLSGLVAADVVVQPSIYEQGAWCPLEALLCGTPAIVSEHTGAGMDMKDIGGGYLIDIYNTVDIADKIDYVLNNKEEAMARARKGAEYIRKNLSLSTSVLKYEAMYEKCLR